ncbi:MAG: hypothetical protein V3S08_07730 [Phycisphaerales bacterium]
MPISGLVIRLDGDDDATRAAVVSMRENPFFTVAAERHTDRVPAVLETATESESRAQIDWAQSLPGVAMVEVAYVNFTDVQHSERNDNGA